MSHAILFTIAVLLLALFFISLFRSPFMMPFYVDDEDEVTTTTTTTTLAEEPHGLNIVGNLERQIEGLQSFVIDPVDGQKVWLNSNDDMYEDAAGKFWQLV